MQVFLILTFCVLLTSALFPSLSSVFPFLFSTPTRRPPSIHLHHNKKEFGRRTSELIKNPDEISNKKRKFHLQVSFGPMIIPNELDTTSTTTEDSYLPFYPKPKTKVPWYSGSTYLPPYGGTELYESEEDPLPGGFTTRVPYTQPPITWKTVKPTYRTTTTTEPYESEEEILPSGFTTTSSTQPTTTRKTTRAPYRSTTSTTTTTEPYESEEEILPGGFTTTTILTTGITESPSFPLFKKIKENIPKWSEWKNILPKIPQSIHLPILTKGKGKGWSKDKSPLQDILNLEDWTSLLPASIRIPRDSREAARETDGDSRLFLPDRTDSKKKQKKKSKPVYDPPAITLTPPLKKPIRTTPSPQKKPKPVPFEDEEDIQPGGQMPKPNQNVYRYEDEQNIQPGKDRARPRPNQNSDSMEQYQAKSTGAIVDDNEEDIQPGAQFPSNSGGYGNYVYPTPMRPSKEIYFFEPPREFNPKKRKPRPTAPPLKPKKEVKVIFIKSPDPELPIIPNIPPIPPNPEQKTVVYVVGKKPDPAPNVTLTLPVETLSPKPDVYYVRYRVTTLPPDEGEEQIDPGGQTPTAGYVYPKPTTRRTTTTPESEEEVLPEGFTPAPTPKPTKPPPIYLPPNTYLPPKTTTIMTTTEPMTTTMEPEDEEVVLPGGFTTAATTEATTTMTTTEPTTTTESEEIILPGGYTTTEPAPTYLPPVKPTITESSWQYLPEPNNTYLPLPPTGGYSGPTIPEPSWQYLPEPNITYLPLPPAGGYAGPPSNAYLPHPPYYRPEYGEPVSNYLNDHNHYPYFSKQHEDEYDSDEDEDEEEDDDNDENEENIQQGGYLPVSQNPSNQLHPPEPYGSVESVEWDRQLNPRKKYRKKKPSKKYGSTSKSHYDRTLYLPKYKPPKYGDHQYRRERKSRAGSKYWKKNRKQSNAKLTQQYNSQKPDPPTSYIQENYNHEEYNTPKYGHELYDNPKHNNNQQHINSVFDNEELNYPKSSQEHHETSNYNQNQYDFLTNNQELTENQRYNQNQHDPYKYKQELHNPQNNHPIEKVPWKLNQGQNEQSNYNSAQQNQPNSQEQIDPRKYRQEQINNPQHSQELFDNPKYNSVQDSQQNYNLFQNSQQKFHPVQNDQQKYNPFQNTPQEYSPTHSPNYNSQEKFQNYNSQEYNTPKYNPSPYNAPNDNQQSQYNNAQKYSPHPPKYEPRQYSNEQFDTPKSTPVLVSPVFNPLQHNPSIYTVDPLRHQQPKLTVDPLNLEPPKNIFDSIQFDSLKFALQHLDDVLPQLHSQDKDNFSPKFKFPEDDTLSQFQNQSPTYSREVPPNDYTSSHYNVPKSELSKYGVHSQQNLQKNDFEPYDSKYYEPSPSNNLQNHESNQQLQKNNFHQFNSPPQFESHDFNNLKQNDHFTPTKYNNPLDYETTSKSNIFPDYDPLQYSKSYDDEQNNPFKFPSLNIPTIPKPSNSQEYNSLKFNSHQDLYNSNSLPPHTSTKSTFESIFDFSKTSPITYNNNKILFPSTFWNGHTSIERKGVADIDPDPNPAFNSLLFDTLGLTLG